MGLHLGKVAPFRENICDNNALYLRNWRTLKLRKTATTFILFRTFNLVIISKYREETKKMSLLLALNDGVYLLVFAMCIGYHS